MITLKFLCIRRWQCCLLLIQMDHIQRTPETCAKEYLCFDLDLRCSIRVQGDQVSRERIPSLHFLWFLAFEFRFNLDQASWCHLHRCRSLLLTSHLSLCPRVAPSALQVQYLYGPGPTVNLAMPHAGPL